MTCPFDENPIDELSPHRLFSRHVSDEEKVFYNKSRPEHRRGLLERELGGGQAVVRLSLESRLRRLSLQTVPY